MGEDKSNFMAFATCGTKFIVSCCTMNPVKIDEKDNDNIEVK